MFPVRDSVSRSTQPVVVWAIIGANVLAFIYQLSLTAPELQVFLYQHALVQDATSAPAGQLRMVYRQLTLCPS
jgi:hypothetical protein